MAKTVIKWENFCLEKILFFVIIAGCRKAILAWEIQREIPHIHFKRVLDMEKGIKILFKTPKKPLVIKPLLLVLQYSKMSSRRSNDRQWHYSEEKSKTKASPGCKKSLRVWLKKGIALPGHSNNNSFTQLLGQKMKISRRI